IHYVLKQHQYDPTDIQVDAMNDYLKALLLVLILEDEFRPVEIQAKNPGTKKSITIKTDLLAEAVGYDTSKKLRIVQAVTDALVQYDTPGPREAMKVVVETLEQEEVTHPKLPLGVAAKQILKMFQRKNRQTVLRKITKDTNRFGVHELDLDLIQQHPLAWLQYGTEAMGLGTFARLRVALQNVNDKQWELTFEGVKQWKKQHDKFPSQKSKDPEERELGLWIRTQKVNYRQGNLSPDRIKKLESIPGWNWGTSHKDGWELTFEGVKQWKKQHDKFPSQKSKDTEERKLGLWIRRQKVNYRQGNLSPDRIKKLESIPGWNWGTSRVRRFKPLPSYHSTSKKVRARQESVIDVYRNVFGRKKLPKGKQYWSMCAVCIGPDGDVLPKSELHQIIEAGLIQPQQFHGVDQDKNIYKTNQRYEHATWYHDDFYSAVSTAADGPDFNPGIVNVDTLLEPKRGVDLFCRVLERLRDVRGVLFVGNFVTQDRWHSYTVDDVVERINQHPRFQEVAHTLRWKPDGAFYHYRGSAKKGRTKMCSVLLWRR
ncbi:MAG: helicase associated domain-containing protein, partial [Dehalococcoidales bacterium]|nr:helicase associated domain-containing protein [Dehalococcoidales bacterium]